MTRTDDVRMVLTHFDYAFGIHGPGGGLASTTWVFEPRPDEGDGDAEMREAVVAAVDLHREVLDGVFAAALKGKRKQAMCERRACGCGVGALILTSGYQYVGRITWIGRRLLGRRLQHLFGSDAAEVRRDSYSGKTRYANIGLVIGGEDRPSDLYLWVTHDLSHAVNATLFRHLLGRDAFPLDEEVAAKAARLDRLLHASAGQAVPVGLWRPERAPPLPPPAAEGEVVSSRRGTPHWRYSELWSSPASC